MVKKKESSVLLGIPDGSIEVDDDVYASKMGGLPLWLDPDRPMASEYCQCKVCGDWMYLLFQSYAPLVDSAYHRVLYVWGCNKRACMKKEGSFCLIRSHRVDEKYLKAQKQKERQKQKEEKTRVQVGFQLGDLWGPSAGSFAQAAAQASQTPLLGSKPKVAPVNEKELTDRLAGLSLSSPPVVIDQLPRFPGHYLYIDQEPNEAAGTIDMSRYQEFLTMETNGEPGEGWGGEGYERQQLPRGCDKHFQKFTERVALEPSQCVRYEWAGLPLFYSALSSQQQQQIATPCPSCLGPRVFEFQLMPNVLSLLPTEQYAIHTAQPHAKQSVLDRWSLGMEFGSILAFVCQKDCHPGSMETTAYMQETLVVQYEQD